VSSPEQLLGPPGRPLHELADLGAEPMIMTPTEFEKLIVDETEKSGYSCRPAHFLIGSVIKPE
jgi:hypothetical protein